MFFRVHTLSDGSAIGYWTDGFEDLYGAGVLILIIAVLVFCFLTLGERLMVPIALILLALMLAYTPQVDDLPQNGMLAMVKFAIALPLLYYAGTSISYTLGMFDGEAEANAACLLTYVAGFIPVLLLTWPTNGVTAPLVLLWAGAFFGGLGGEFPTTTNFLLHLFYLESVGILIYGLVKVIKEHDTNGIYIVPKTIAFALGCVPIAAFFLLPGLNEWIAVVLAVALYLTVYFVYAFALKQPSLFADFLLHPFLWLLFIYMFVEGYSLYPGFLFPSDVVQVVYGVLAPLQGLCDPALAMCGAFGEAVSDLIHLLTGGLFAILPNVGLSGFWVDVPWFVGAVIGILLVAGICNGAAALYEKSLKARRDRLW